MVFELLLIEEAAAVTQSVHLGHISPIGIGEIDPREVRDVSRSSIRGWARDGYVLAPGLLDGERESLAEASRALLDDLDHGDASDLVVRYENNFDARLPPSARVSKLIRVHRRAEFARAVLSDQMQQLLGMLIGADVDLFLSQLVFKYPGAYGQPWHQDPSLFPFEPERPVIAIWVALTDPSPSPLEVKIGSHRGGVLPHGHDAEDATKGRYLALTAQPDDTAKPLPMAPGDAAIFDSYLIHRSADNASDRVRIALVYHFATAGTVDRTAEVLGRSPFNEWTPVRRKGAPVRAAAGR